MAIHRVRKTFDQVHGHNTFLYGDIDDVGIEIIVEGKNFGDKYRIKNNVITMVHRHIQGKLIKIYTDKTIDTDNGYLSKNYSDGNVHVSIGIFIKKFIIDYLK